MRMTLIALAALVLLPSADLLAQQLEVVEVPGMKLEGLPFSPAVKAGGFIFPSGQIGIDVETMQLAPGGVAGEMTKAMENMRTVLEAAGASLSDVVKCTVFLSDMADYGTANEAYIAFFPGAPPARSAVAVNGLAFGALLEVECIAVDPAAD
jgi:2-iminobutanoate/2-iminopropanoate deaminase